jgi:hypothetical protein
VEHAVGGSGEQVDDRRGWLIEQRSRLDAGEAAWLAELARFDASGEWAADGQLSATGWLVVFCRMSRATAFDKVRVARQLALRPQVAAALDEGRISYSAARAITRAEDPSPEVDEALVTVAESATVADVERVVRTYQAYRDQDRPLDERIERRRGIRFLPTGDGLVRIEGYLTELEAAELRTVLELLIEVEDRRESSAEDSPKPAHATAPAPAQSSAEDPVSPQHRAARRVDALVDLARIAGGALRQGGYGGGRSHGGGADRYTAHVITLAGQRSTSLDGTPHPPGEAERVACDSGIVHHHYSSAGEPLALGRRTRSWSSAQQRAARVRDGGHCRFPGCGRLVVDLHHLRWWEHGGRTDIDNGLLLCTRHHTLVHEGVFAIAGRPNEALTFLLPGGEVIGVTRPRIGALLQPHLVPA